MGIISIAALVFIGMLTLLSGAIAASGAIYENKHLTKKGVSYGIVGLITVLLLIFQYYIQQSIDSAKDEKNATEQNNREANLRLKMRKSYDSSVDVMKGKFDKSDSTLTLIVATTLGKYGVKLDTTKRELKRMMDTAKTRIVGDAPILMLDNGSGLGVTFIGDYNNYNKYYLHIISKDAASTGYDIKYSILIRDTLQGLVYMANSNNWLQSTDMISKDATFDREFTLVDTYRYKYVYIYLRGKYKDMNNKTYQIDQVYYWYGNNVNQFGTLLNFRKQEIIDKVNENEQ